MIEKDAKVDVKSLLLRTICAAYLIAFLSYYHQSPGLSIKLEASNIDSWTISKFLRTQTGLIGENGISPAVGMGSIFSLTSDHVLDILSLTGAVLSFVG